MSLIHVLGDNVKMYREDAGITQTCLSKLTGISLSNIGYIEQGRTNLCISNVEKVSNALNVSPCLLVANSRIDIRGIGFDDFKIPPVRVGVNECAFCINTKDGMEFYPIESNDDFYVISMLSYLKKKGYYGYKLIQNSQRKSVPLI